MSPPYQALRGRLPLYSTAGVGVAVRRRLIAIAPLICLAGMLAVTAGMWKRDLPLTAVCWSMFGAGIGMTWPHLASLLIASSPESERKAASAFVTLLQIGTAALGAALAGMVANVTGLPKAITRAEVSIAAFVLLATFVVAPLLATFTTNRVLRHENSYRND